MNGYTTIIKQEDQWWIGWIEEIPGVNCQERSLEKLKETLAVTLKEALLFNKCKKFNPPKTKGEIDEDSSLYQAGSRHGVKI